MPGGQWVPKPDFYGPGGGDWVDPNGMSTPDPWGALNPQAGAMGLTSVGGQAPMPVTPTPVAPTGPMGLTAVGPNQPLPAPAPAAVPPTPPGLPSGSATPPTPPGPGKGPDFVSVTDSKTSTSTGTTGLDADSAARVSAGIDRQQGAAQTADTAAVSFEQFKAQQMAQQAQAKLAGAAEGLSDVAAKQAVQDHIAEEVDRRLNAGGPNSKDVAGLGSAYWRPDPTELFHGDHGALFGLSAAIAAMSGAWMQGRGLTGQNPYLPTVMKIIDDNVNNQVRQNSQAFQHLKDLKGDVKAAKLELKERQLSYAQAQSDGMSMRANSEIVQKGSAVLAEKLTAEREKVRAEQEKQLNKTVTQNVTKEVSRRQVANPANAAGADANKPKDRTPQQARAESVRRSANEFGSKAGLVRDASGKWVVSEKGIVPPGFIESINPFDDNSIQAAGEQLAEQYGRLQSQGAIGVTEKPEFREQVGLETGNRLQLAAKLNTLENAIEPLGSMSDIEENRTKSNIPGSWK